MAELIARVSWFLEESKRRNADSYQPDFITAEVIEKFLDKDGWYISFTNIPKLGINPTTVYNTPMAIYAYPIKEAYNFYSNNEVGNTVSSGAIFVQSLPFGNEAKYAWIFNLKPEANAITLYNDKAGQKHAVTYNDKLPRLITFLNEKSYSTKVMATKVKKILVADLQELYDKGAPIDINILYRCIYRSLSKIFPQAIGVHGLSKPKTRLSTTIASLTAKLLRLCGVDAIVDMGTSTIHENEPMQVAVLNPAVINKKVLTFNKVHKSIATIRNKVDEYFRLQFSKDWSMLSKNNRANNYITITHRVLEYTNTPELLQIVNGDIEVAPQHIKDLLLKIDEVLRIKVNLYATELIIKNTTLRKDVVRIFNKACTKIQNNLEEYEEHGFAINTHYSHNPDFLVQNIIDTLGIEASLSNTGSKKYLTVIDGVIGAVEETGLFKKLFDNELKVQVLDTKAVKFIVFMILLLEGALKKRSKELIELYNAYIEFKEKLNASIRERILKEDLNANTK